MPRTSQLGLPLVMPAQAQKHVTVNEAFSRIDAATQLRIVFTDGGQPQSPLEGACYIVPEDAGGDWTGQGGRISVFSNGGWVFLTPKVGWRAWDDTLKCHSFYDGTEWIPDAIAASPHGAAVLWKVNEFLHTLVSGASNITSGKIPAQAQVVGVTGRVVEAITGTGLTGWRLGVNGAEGRYGSGLGTSRGSYALGISGAPVTYYSDTPLLITGEDGSFSGGEIRLAIHYVALKPPRSV